MSKETEDELRKQLDEAKLCLIVVLYAPICTFALFAVANHFGWLY